MHQEGPSQQMLFKAHGASPGIASLRVQSDESMFLYEVNQFLTYPY